MNATDILKGLRNCSATGTCRECPFDGTTEDGLGCCEKLLLAAADLIEQQMKKTPCNIGDKIYSLLPAEDFPPENLIDELTVTGVGIEKIFCSGYVPPEDDIALEIPLSDIGKTVFLTREEAEKKWRK